MSGYCKDCGNTLCVCSDLSVHWTQQERGWWTAWTLIGMVKHCMGVCKERDGKWHSYVSGDTIQRSPGFRTMKLAMTNAEIRTKPAS